MSMGIGICIDITITITIGIGIGNGNGNTHTTIDTSTSPKVEESIECVFGHQLEEGLEISVNDDDDDDDANLEIENAGIVASNEAIISQDDMNMDKDSETIIGNGHNPLHQDNVEERTDITPLDSSRGWIETSLCVELSDMMDCTHSKKKKDRHSNSSISGHTTAGDLILPAGLDLKTFRRSMIKRQIFTAIGVAIIMAMPQIIPQMLAFKLKSILSIPFWRSLMEFLTVAMQ
mmetsp:Transcript_17984/g.27274  ORF Transcript_17984/g.27274 Transcript_17984/m.27274 type:complete len:233 (-) Transcript_17984:63-761(-)